MPGCLVRHGGAFLRLGSDWLAECRTEGIAELRFDGIRLTRLGFTWLAEHELGDIAGRGLNSICLARLSSASRLAEVWLVGCGLEGVARLRIGLGSTLAGLAAPCRSLSVS